MARVDTLTNFLTDVADAIRTKTGSQETIQASSFDTAIENIPSGGGGSPYLVSSTQEMNALQNVQDGDICVIYSDTLEPVGQTFQTTQLNFPQTVVFDTAITQNKYVNYHDFDEQIFMDIQLRSDRCRIISADLGFFIEYTTSDGITYTRSGDTESVTVPDIVFLGEYDENCAKFVLISNVNFSGIYQYENGAWVKKYPTT